VLDDQKPRAMPHDAPRFREDDLDEARVLAEFGGKRYGALGRHDAVELGIAALRLRHDLLRHHEYVAVSQSDLVRGERRDRDGAEIVSRLDELDAGKPDQREMGTGGHAQPNLLRNKGNTCSA
jgi:hypothetical protein